MATLKVFASSLELVGLATVLFMYSSLSTSLASKRKFAQCASIPSEELPALPFQADSGLPIGSPKMAQEKGVCKE